MGVFTSIIIGSMIAGYVVKAVAAKKAGTAARKAGEAMADVAESQAGVIDWNAKVADIQAADAVQRGAIEESRFREGVDVMVGTQRAGAAGANVDVGYGSALDVQADARFLGELDALMIRTNAAREAWGYKVQAEDLRKRAAITRKEGKNAITAGRTAQSAANWQVASIAAGGAADSLLAARYGFGKS